MVIIPLFTTLFNFLKQSTALFILKNTAVFVTTEDAFNSNLPIIINPLIAFDKVIFIMLFVPIYFFGNS